MNTTPPWKAARTGTPGDLDAINHASQIDQFLGTHGITPIYEGTPIVNPYSTVVPIPFYNSITSELNYGNTTDIAQPFVMPGGSTAIGRVTIPVFPAGAGADLLVSLCPDNGSGAPNTADILAATTVPASWITNLSASAGLSTGGALATARNKAFYAPAPVQNFLPWNFPAGGSVGSISDPTVSASGNYLLMVGGIASGGPTPSASVFTAQYQGGGILGPPTGQPALPQATINGMVATVSGFIVVAGGGNASTRYSNTWVASWDVNTGTVGSWSAQAALPVAFDSGASASWQTTVYLVGGSDGTNTLNTVYYATIDNGQLTTWLTGPPLPVAVTFPFLAVVGNWLVFTGGRESPATTANGATYYSAINSDGSLGPWRQGPSMPYPTYTTVSGYNFCLTDSAIAVVGDSSGMSGIGGSAIQVLTVGTTGPSDSWSVSMFDISIGGFAPYVAFNTGSSGVWEIISPFVSQSSYIAGTIGPVPLISVPLPAAGLIPGSTYHVVIQQHQTSSAEDYINYGVLTAALPHDALKSARHSGTWTTAQTSYSVPLTVYDQTVGGPILHTWQDPSATGSTSTSNLAAQATTMVYNQYGLLVGVCEATTLPNDPMNANPTFTSGTSPWVAHNGTLTQSSAQVHGGYAFSGLLTPAGGFATASATSELVPIKAVFPQFSTAQWYQVNGWLYSPTGWASVSLSIDWYDATSTYLSTSSSVTSPAAATWTNLVNTYQPPATAAFGSINVTEPGTPGSSNLLYLSNVTLTLSPELTSTVPSVAEITYSGIWPPTGVNQLV